MNAENFPDGTKFFLSDDLAPIALMPDGKATFGYGHFTREYSHKLLVFMLETPSDGFRPVSFDDFAKTVAELIIAERLPKLNALDVPVSEIRVTRTLNRVEELMKIKSAAFEERAQKLLEEMRAKSKAEIASMSEAEKFDEIYNMFRNDD